jgi:hypothetical protein
MAMASIRRRNQSEISFSPSYSIAMSQRLSLPLGPRSRSVAVNVRATDASKMAPRPEMKRPEMKETPSSSSPAAAVATPTSTSPSIPAFIAPGSGGAITLEYQRMRAKEMVRYFKEMKLEEQIVQARGFGWTSGNEISNGRWVMFGLMVGMLTEYATGVDFPEQLKLMATNLSIFDFE